MSLVSFVPGVSTTFSSDLNSMYGESISLTLKEHVRTLIDRSVSYSTDGSDLWGEAFTSSTGRNGLVLTSNSETTATFSTNKYITTGSATQYIELWGNESSSLYNAFNSSVSKSILATLTSDWEAGGSIRYKFRSLILNGLTGTLHDPDSFTNPSNAFDSDLSTSATKAGTGSTTYVLGKTFTSQVIDKVRVKFSLSATNGGSAYLQSYDGSVWSNIVTIGTGYVADPTSVDTIYTITSAGSIQGLRLALNTGSTGAVTISVFALETFSVEDSGWLSANSTVGSFTAFTNPINNILIELNPDVSDIGIYGFAVRCS